MHTETLNALTRVEPSIVVSQFSGEFLEPHLSATPIIYSQWLQSTNNTSKLWQHEKNSKMLHSITLPFLNL